MNRSILWLVCVLISVAAYGQKDKTELQKEKQRNLNKIKETEKILRQTANEKKVSMGELTALNRRIEQQEILIGSILEEINHLDQDIAKNNETIDALEKDLKQLKAEYAAMLYAAQKANGKADRLAFLFSAKTFDQLMMRIKYMEQYGDARRKQTEAIVSAQKVLRDHVLISEARRSEMEALLNEEEQEKTKLSALKAQQKTLVAELSKQEKRLRRELQQTRKAVRELDAVIAKIIREEIEKAAAEAKAKKNKSVPDRASPEMVALSNNFTENKRKIPWPVSGFISQKFGKQPHPVLKGIVIQNDGINIQTNQNEAVKVIFDGEVRKIASNQLLGQSVIVKHGDYFTIYTCLKDIQVKPGDKVARGQVLGKVLTNAQGISELRFQIWKSINKLNPQDWLLP